MADVTFIGGPLNGRVQSSDGSPVNVIDDSRRGAVRLVTYRVDLDERSARVVAEADI